ncbi:MAG: hypothetical protein R3F60_00590 [bacterium]
MEEDDPGMGVIKRRRSRRLLETRKVAEGQSDRRVTTHEAASAWGDMLARESAPPTDVHVEDSLPPPVPPPMRAPLRGVPLSSRPPSALPPDLSEEPPRRGPLPAERLSAPPGPIAAPRGQVSVLDPATARGAPPSSTPPSPGLAASAPPTAVAPDAWPDAGGGLPVWPTETGGGAAPVWPEESKPPRAEPAEEAPRPANPTLEVPAVVVPSPPARSPWPIVALVVLILGAIAWTGAVLFDEMGRTDRLERVGRALSAAGQRIASEHPDLAHWPGSEPDAVAMQQMVQAETPRLVEAVSAAGYTPGVFSVAIREHPADAAVVLEAQVPEATIAFITGGKWQKPPPETGIMAAVRSNLASIALSFALPLGLFIGLLVRRRRAG